MKEHILTMVYLGLLALMFNSPFPNRLLKSDITIEGEPIIYPMDQSDQNFYQLPEYNLEKDSTLKLSPGAAAYLGKNNYLR